jgi:hypothetical protein
MIKRIITQGVFLLCATSAIAADEALVRELLTKSKFRAGVERDIRTSRAGLPANKVGQFISRIDFTKIENAYVESMMSNMSNNEVQALIRAFEIPGYEEASRKQIIAAVPAINAIISELTRVSKSFSSDK